MRAAVARSDPRVPLRLYDVDGNEQGEAESVVIITVGETIATADGRHLRVVDQIPTWGVSEMYVGLLSVEPV